MSMEHLVIAVLLSLLVVVAIGIIVLRDLLAAVILSGVYSLVAAAAFVVMDAVDVAFTEAAVGAGISTILFLGALSHSTHAQKARGHDSVLVLVFVMMTGALLVYGTLDMPRYGRADSPANTHEEVAVRYIKESAHEVGPPNVVTSVLGSYRGYDTLGETAVVFTAGIAVLSLLGLRRRHHLEETVHHAPGDKPRTRTMEHARPVSIMKRHPRQRHRILQIMTRLLAPFILLFALYVQFHGDYGPGGGFQAGVIFAAAFVLCGLVMGVQRTRELLPPSVLRIFMAIGLMLYAGTGLLTMLLGGALLDYDAFSADYHIGQHWGLFTIELGVGITVASVMVSLYYSFASKRR